MATRYPVRRDLEKDRSRQLLAVLRTDANARRPLPIDSELAQAVAVLVRAQQDAVWDRNQAGNKLRSHLREYFPGWLAVGRRSDSGAGRSACPRPAAGGAQAAAAQSRPAMSAYGRRQALP
ncbi:transposase [Streptomyces goshikiensis]|uniref:IS110 family transposase n=1 Tax=Streptomyces goshikiensis TaxID=1942 RepID=UPI0036D04EA4